MFAFLLLLTPVVGQVPAPMETLTEEECVRILRERGTASTDGTAYSIDIGTTDDPQRADYWCAVAAQLPRVRQITIFGSAVSKHGMESLASIQDLEDLDCWGKYPSDEAYSVIPRMPALRSLTCSLQTTDEGVRHIAQLTRLTKLGLGATQVTGEGLKHLTNLKNLRELDLMNSKVKDDISPLKDLLQLEKLNLAGTGVDDKALAVIAGLPRLKYLGLGFTKVTDDSIATLETFPLLDSLSVRGSKVTNHGLAQLSQSGVGQSLKELFIDENPIDDEGVEALSTMKSLESIWAVRTGIKKRQIAKIQTKLPNCRIVK